MSATDAPKLAFDGVNHAFDDERALAEVALSVRSGERVAVVGPSGAGKTTLLRLAAGAIRPDSGTVTFDGRPVTTDDTALAYQGETLVDRRTVLSNVLSGRAGDLSWWRGILEPIAPRDPAPALELLDAVGLADRAGARADELSAGERQRVALARAAIQGADAVLADEPTANLDPRTRSAVLDVLDDVVGDRLLVTALHDVDLALDRFDRVVGLADGRVRFDEPAESVTEAALDRLFALEDSAEESEGETEDRNGNPTADEEPGRPGVEWYA